MSGRLLAIICLSAALSVLSALSGKLSAASGIGQAALLGCFAVAYVCLFAWLVAERRRGSGSKRE